MRGSLKTAFSGSIPVICSSFLDAEACKIKASAISFNNPQGVHWGTPLESVENLVDFHCRNKSESGRTFIMICCAWTGVTSSVLNSCLINSCFVHFRYSPESHFVWSSVGNISFATELMQMPVNGTF